MPTWPEGERMTGEGERMTGEGERMTGEGERMAGGERGRQKREHQWRKRRAIGFPALPSATQYPTSVLDQDSCQKRLVDCRQPSLLPAQLQSATLPAVSPARAS